MINEEKVKEEFNLARIDERYPKEMARVGRHFRWDYVAAQILWSILGGTVCFVLVAVLWGMWNADSLMADINSLDYIGMAMTLMSYYVVFLGGYLFLTLLVYFFRYGSEHRIMQEYLSHVRKLGELYARDEKLKS